MECYPLSLGVKLLPFPVQQTILLLDLALQLGDVVGFSFYVAGLALFATALFLMFERLEVGRAWKTPMTISIIILTIAGIQYFYMHNLWVDTGTSPTQFRYIDWFLTVPLLCMQFYFVLQPCREDRCVLVRLLAGALVILVFGYIGQAVYVEMNMLWGLLSTMGWGVVIYEIYLGEAAQLAKNQPLDSIRKGFYAMRWITLIGWGIYPIGYMLLPGNVLHFLVLHADITLSSPLDLTYNIGDCVNKIGFVLIIYNTAKAATQQELKLL